MEGKTTQKIGVQYRRVQRICEQEGIGSYRTNGIDGFDPAGRLVARVEDVSVDACWVDTLVERLNAGGAAAEHLIDMVRDAICEP